jgi:hypothetical protein
MSEIDTFARTLLEEAKRFLEKAQEHEDDAGVQANLHAAIMLGFCALEAHVNSVADDFAGINDLSVHEKGLMLEKDVRFDDGHFVLTDNLKMARLDERIQFIYRRFSGDALDRSASWWSELRSALKLRNELTHPKDVTDVDVSTTNRALQAIIDTIDAIYQAVYKAKFPAAGRGLLSKLTF